MTTHTNARTPAPARTTGVRVPQGMRSRVGISLLPALVLFSTFFLLPLGVLIATAFGNWSGSDFEFVGLDNFRRMLADPVFWKALGNTVFYLSVSLLVQVPIGVAVGMVLATRLPGWRAFRALLFIPFVIFGAAYALIFSMFYNSRFGLLNNLVAPLGIAGRDWLYETSTARWAISGTFVFILGFIIVVIMAEIASIPTDLHEAATIDGASGWQQQIYITLPLLRSAIGTCLLVRLLADIGMFDLVFILTAGGPNDSTATLALYAYRSYLLGEWGYANAVGGVILLLGATLIISVRRAFRLGERAL
jgi:raffinose/stachyose/melibiose transport system permease protein